MDRDSVEWQGYIPAITTPFDEAGSLDVDALRELLRWLVGERMHGLVLAGTTGEWFSLSPEEKETLFRTAAEVVNGAMPLLGGCTAFTAREAVANAALATEAGLDGIFLTPPPYVRPSAREILHFYGTVDERCELPICIYNWPPGTGVDMSLDLLTDLAELSNVVAIKHSTADDDHFLNVFRALNDRVRIFGIPMNARGIEMVRDEGGVGTMGAGAVLGREHPEFYEAIWRGDDAAARRVAERDGQIMRDWFRKDLTGRFGSAQAILKTALNLQGLPGGFPREPILPVATEDEPRIAATLVNLGRLDSTPAA